MSITRFPFPQWPRSRRQGMVATGILAVVLATGGASAAPAGAAIDGSPQAVSFGPVSCPEAGLHFDEVWLPAAPATPGHVLDDKLVGVAKSLYLTDSAGHPLVAIFDRPGGGLDANTIWCFWPFPASPTGFAGGDILFNANLRP